MDGAGWGVGLGAGLELVSRRAASTQATLRVELFPFSVLMSVSFIFLSRKKKKSNAKLC